MDTFFEQIISIRKTGKTLAGIIGIWFLALVLCFLAFLFSGYLMSFSLIIVAGIIFGAFKLSQRFNIEYEYIITNGSMDIDKIISKSSRKRVASFELSGVSRLEKFNQNMLNNIKSKELIIACNLEDEGAYFMATSTEGKGAVNLVFAPDDRIKSAIVKFAPKFISNSAFK